MARQNYHARRTELAQARGFSSYYQYRKTLAAEPVRESRTRTRDGREATRTRNEGRADAAVRRAAADDQKIYVRVGMLLDPGDGSDPSTWQRHDVELYARGGWDASAAADAIDDYGSAFAMFKDQIDALEKYSGVIVDVTIRSTP